MATQPAPQGLEDLVLDMQRRIGAMETNTALDTRLNQMVAPGCVSMFAGTSAPSGFLLCDGSTVDRVVYAALFETIGTTYGAGNGSTTFTLPNLKGRVVAGRDAAQTEFDTLGEVGGTKTVALTEAQMPSHTHAGPNHTHTTPNHSHLVDGHDTGTDMAPQGNRAYMTTGGNVDFSTFSGGGGTTGSAAGTTGSAGSDQAHPNLQPYIVLNYIIKT